MKKVIIFLVCSLFISGSAFAQNYQLLHELPPGAELVSEFYGTYGYKESFDYDGNDILEIAYESEGTVYILDGTDFSLIAEFSLNEIGLESLYIEESGFFDIDADDIKELVIDLGDGIKIIDIRDATVEFEFQGGMEGCIDLNNDGYPELITKLYSENNEIIQIWGAGNVSKVAAHSNPTAYKLSQNYPNPFNPVTTIEYSVQLTGNVQLKIYNTAGQLVRALIDEQKPVGEYSVQWDGNNENGMRVSSGAYYYQLKVGDFTSSRKMILLK